MKIVLGSGPNPCRYMLIGEAPGKVEARTEIPFTGPSGKLLDSYLQYSNLPSLRSWYKTNLVKHYQEGNPDPTLDQIIDWTPVLLSELEEVQPEIILTVGRHSTNFFLGASAPSLDIIHGMAHKVSDLSRKDLPECISKSIIFPVLHPAGGLWNHERRSIIRYGYDLAGWSLSRLNKGLDIHYRKDIYAGQEDYIDVSGSQLESILNDKQTISNWKEFYSSRNLPLLIGHDTEGIPGDRWSTQWSLLPGQGYLLRCSQDDFSRGISALHTFLRKHRPTIAMHQASTPVCSCYDVVASREMGLELQGLEWFDTMCNAFIYRLESQANKVLCERWQGMHMEDYESTIGGIGRNKQIDYLGRALIKSENFPKPEKRVEKLNTGKVKTSQPKHIHASIGAILADIANGKTNKDGIETSPIKRWKGLLESNPTQVRLIESILGPMPTANLGDISLDRATVYACKDSDGSLRNAITFIQRNRDFPEFTSLMREGMEYLPIVERIQHNGMPVSISMIKSLHHEMQTELDALNVKISNLYWEGKDFNPCSPPQVAALCRRLGIKPALKTDTGAASTSKKSIEEYRYTTPAIADVFDFRERQHNRDMYCNDVISRVPEGYTDDLLIISANFHPTKIPTRRLAASNPNILGIPIRTELGKRVRDCYIAPPGMIFCSYDLSGAEVRCLAHLSRDPLLMRVFKLKINPHLDTAMRLFGLSSINDVSPLQKAVAKTVNFLVIYGGGANNLYDQFRSNNIRGYDLNDCKRFIRQWFETYKGVDDYRKKVILRSKLTEKASDLSGMVRYLPGINCGDNQIESEEGRAAVSQEVQGLAQTAIRNSTIWIYKRLQYLIDAGEIHPQCLRLQVHDELDFLVNEGEEETLTPLVLEGLTKHHGINFIVPIEAEAHYGKSWGDCK